MLISAAASGTEYVGTPAVRLRSALRSACSRSDSRQVARSEAGSSSAVRGMDVVVTTPPPDRQRTTRVARWRHRIEARRRAADGFGPGPRPRAGTAHLRFAWQ